jgi:3-phenylpropionate/cinnamic acid dioxygenase small subunit
MIAVDRPHRLTLEERFEVNELYMSYAEALNDDRLEDWPGFFTEACRYQVLSRENAERNFPLAIIRAESRGMLADRVTSIRKAMLFAPHYWLHLISGVHILNATDDAIEVRANYCIVRTMENRPSDLFQVGRYQDRIVRDGDRLRFSDKICIYDSALIPNSLVYPI